MTLHIIGFGQMPEPIRRFLDESSDPEKAHMRHEINAREKAAFWESLDKEQLGYIIGILGGIARCDVDEAQPNAARAMGTAEAYMEQKFKSCGCGREHRDPSTFFEELEAEAKKSEAERVEAEALGLHKIQDEPGIPSHMVGKFACKACAEIFDTVEARRSAAVGDGHDGCHRP